jgi:hypothetical protein
MLVNYNNPKANRIRENVFAKQRGFRVGRLFDKIFKYSKTRVQLNTKIGSGNSKSIPLGLAPALTSWRAPGF